MKTIINTTSDSITFTETVEGNTITYKDEFTDLKIQYKANEFISYFDKLVQLPDLSFVKIGEYNDYARSDRYINNNLSSERFGFFEVEGNEEFSSAVNEIEFFKQNCFIGRTEIGNLGLPISNFIKQAIKNHNGL